MRNLIMWNMVTLDGFFKDILIFGSADLSSTLMQNKLIDEYRLGMNPIVLGGGGPLFKPSPHRMRMRLLEARPLKAGCVILRYQPVGEG
jgi:dihydrofolate reductase